MGKNIFILFAIILLTSLTIYKTFHGISTEPLERWDEETNISVIRESLQYNSLPVLYYQHKPFFEKPPIWYWINSIIAMHMDISLLSMRLVSSFSGLFILLFTPYLAWKWWGTLAGVTSWIVLLTTEQLFTKNVGGFFSSHTLTTADVDSLQIACILTSFAMCVSRRYISAGITGALAFLIKGPLGLFPLFVVLFFSLLKKEKISSTYWMSLCISIVIIIPWYVYMIYLFNGQFLYNHFIYHITVRSFTPIEGHVHSLLYYIHILLTPSVFSSGVFLVGSVVYILSKRRVLSDDRVSFTFTTFVLLLVLLTSVQTRLAWYILPLYPLAALLIGYVFNDIFSDIHIQKIKNFSSLFFRLFD